MTLELSPACIPARTLLSRALAATPQRLDWAALAIAALGQPDLLPDATEAVLDGYAARVRATMELRQDALSRVQALRGVLADEEGFRGDPKSHQGPENSFLPRVLESRVGLPITLSVLYLEVARRAGVPLFGVAFPGHFLVACEGEREKLVLDPFQGGKLLTETGCADLLAQVAPQVRFGPRLLSAAPVSAIARRMLNNLKRVYLAREEETLALQVVDLLLLLAPDHPGELRTRAALLASQGAYRAALADVERCLSLSPNSPDHESLQMRAQVLRHQVAFLH